MLVCKMFRNSLIVAFLLVSPAIAATNPTQQNIDTSPSIYPEDFRMTDCPIDRTGNPKFRKILCDMLDMDTKSFLFLPITTTPTQEPVPTYLDR